MSSFRTDLTVDQAQLERDLDRWISDVLRAGTGAVRATTRKLEKAIEGATRSTIRGRMWRAWKSQSFPSADIPAYSPSGTVYINGGPRSQGAARYWTQPGVNKAKSGQYLAVPIVGAPGIGRMDRDLTPGQWERQHGMRLRFVYRGGTRASLLVVDGAFNRHGGVVKYDAAKVRGGQDLRQATIPVFVLIPFQRHANRVSINPIVLRHEAILAQDLAARVAKLERVR